MAAITVASCSVTSMWAPGRAGWRQRPVSAMVTADAAARPAIVYDGLAAPCTGVPRGSPEIHTRPPAAPATRSLALRSAHGESSPNGVIDSWISPGLTDRRASWPRRSPSSRPGCSVSITTWAVATSRRKVSAPSAVARSTTTDRLLALRY